MSNQLQKQLKELLWKACICLLFKQNMELLKIHIHLKPNIRYELFYRSPLDQIEFLQRIPDSSDEAIVKYFQQTYGLEHKGLDHSYYTTSALCNPYLHSNRDPYHKLICDIQHLDDFLTGDKHESLYRDYCKDEMNKLTELVALLKPTEDS